MNRLRTAVIGAGYLGRFHAQKLDEIATAELVGICDIDAETGQNLARDCNTVYYADHKDCLLYTSDAADE